MNKWQTITISIITALSLAWANDLANIYHKLTIEQKNVLQSAYNYGKEYNLGYSMAAIAWQESFVGNLIVPINLQDPSAGIWHKNVYIALAESSSMGNTGLSLNMMADRLIDDTEFAASLAIADLEHWKVLRNGRWLDIWASYNAGRYYSSEKGQKYAYSIRDKIKILKRNILKE